MTKRNTTQLPSLKKYELQNNLANEHSLQKWLLHKIPWSFTSSLLYNYSKIEIL